MFEKTSDYETQEDLLAIRCVIRCLLHPDILHEIIALKASIKLFLKVFGESQPLKCS